MLSLVNDDNIKKNIHASQQTYSNQILKHVIRLLRRDIDVFYRFL